MLILATDRDVVVCAGEGFTWRVTHRTLTGHHVTAVIAREGVILAGTRNGIFRSDNGGESWIEQSEGLATRLVRWLAFNPEVSDLELAGTEPAGIFTSSDGGATWHSCPEVAELRDLGKWFLPYSPEAGCVRDFAFHGSRVYAAVEVGGLLSSDDGGRTWGLVAGTTGRGTLDHAPSGMTHSDVHSVVAHDASADRVLAATSAGLFISENGGETWRSSHAGSYCRAVWVDGGDFDHLILGPADGVSRNGRIEESRDGGRTWTIASRGLDLPWPRRMVERFYQLDSRLLAISDDGRLYMSDLQDLSWRPVLNEVGGITAVAATTTQ